MYMHNTFNLRAQNIIPERASTEETRAGARSGF